MRTHLLIFTQKARQPPMHDLLNGSGWLWNNFGVARDWSFADHPRQDCALIICGPSSLRLWALIICGPSSLRVGRLTPSPRAAANLRQARTGYGLDGSGPLLDFRIWTCNRVSRMGVYGMRMEPATWWRMGTGGGGGTGEDDASTTGCIF